MSEIITKEELEATTKEKNTFIKAARKSMEMCIEGNRKVVSEELKQLISTITNIRELAGLLSTQDLTKEHPEHALMFLEQAFNQALDLFLAECEKKAFARQLEQDGAVGMVVSLYDMGKIAQELRKK